MCLMRLSTLSIGKKKLPQGSFFYVYMGGGQGKFYATRGAGRATTPDQSTTPSTQTIHLPADR